LRTELLADRLEPRDAGDATLELTLAGEQVSVYIRRAPRP
jgi:hypothetical protein